MSCTGKRCECRGFSFEEIPPIIERMDNVRHTVSLMYVRDKQWGFNTCNTFEEYESNKELDLYRRVLDRHLRFYYLGSKGSLKCTQLTEVVRKTNHLINLTPCDTHDPVLETDNSGLDSWVLLNPNCVPRQRWEFCALRKLPTIKVTATENNNCMNIVYELAAREILCDLTYEIQQDNDKTDCTIDYNILKQEISCDIDYDLYQSIRDCGITDGIIRKVLDCGLNFGWSSKDSQPCIIDGTNELLLGQLNELNLA
jgi:hypothetical protein